MIFSSIPYVLFLLVVVCLYWRLPERFRTPLLLVASYVFYMCWSPPFGILYAPVIFFDSLYFYWLSLAMVRWPDWKKRILVFGVVTELCLLGYFKYANFLARSIDALMSWAGLPPSHVEFDVFLPLAISFTNFVLISYLVDVYRGDEVPDKSFTRFATYVAFFPHLIAGPIVRAKELLHQLSERRAFSRDWFGKGVDLFLVGLSIKVFVADFVAPYVDLIFSTPALQGFDTNWVALYGFAVQIFCDFAGYTLMAQGSALMMGLTLPDNFDAPYFALNIRDFWRRWHMSLSRWLRDYLYIPLGGSRGTKLETSRNLFITMGLGGLWHGANWTFVAWGLYQGLLLSLHKACETLKLTRWVPKLLAWFITFHAVCLGWAFFRASDWNAATAFIGELFQPWHRAGLLGNPAVTGGKSTLMMVALFFAAHWTYRTWGSRIQRENLLAWSRGVVYFIFFYALLTLQTQSQPFIYFQF